MLPLLVSMVGITTMVRYSSGIPFEKSILGNKEGFDKIVVNQLISEVAN